MGSLLYSVQVSEAVAKLNGAVLKPSAQLGGCPVHVETAFH